MKTLIIDDDVYAYIAANTESIGESASDILRRLLPIPGKQQQKVTLDTDKAELLEVIPDEEPSECLDTPEDKHHVCQSSHDWVSVTKHCSSVVDKFLTILGELHQRHPLEFNGILAIKGRNRLYYATSKDALLASGSSTNPKAIPNSDFWVVTNNNTSKKQSLLEQVLNVLEYSSEQNTLISQLLQ